MKENGAARGRRRLSQGMGGGEPERRQARSGRGRASASRPKCSPPIRTPPPSLSIFPWASPNRAPVLAIGWLWRSSGGPGHPACSPPRFGPCCPPRRGRCLLSPARPGRARHQGSGLSHRRPGAGVGQGAAPASGRRGAGVRSPSGSELLGAQRAAGHRGVQADPGGTRGAASAGGPRLRASDSRGGPARRGPRDAADDVLDAMACLWTARRIVQDAARSIPTPPERDGAGLPMAI
jgi:hypothetical protein